MGSPTETSLGLTLKVAEGMIGAGASPIAEDVRVSPPNFPSGNGPVEYSLTKIYLNLLTGAGELSHTQTSIFSVEL